MSESAVDADDKWRRNMARFLRFMREEKGWRRHWIIFRQVVTCIGVASPPPRPKNDNFPIR